MYYSKILPFLEKAEIKSIERHTGVYSKDILKYGLFYDLKYKDCEYIVNKIKLPIRAYKVDPLGLVVLDINPIDATALVRTKDIISVDLYTVDYSRVAEIITVDETAKMSFYPMINGFIPQEIETDELINKASNGVIVINPRTTSSVSNPTEAVAMKEGLDCMEILDSEVLNEANSKLLSKLSSMKRNSSYNIDIDSKPSPMSVRLESYLKGGYVTQRVPLLIGATAVAKSASVKTLCQKYGFRLVDLRTAFMSRLDLEGLTEIIPDENGVPFSYNAAMYEMVQCTDNYINFCKDSVPKIEEVLKEEKLKEDMDVDKVAKLEKLLQNYKEMAKPPVLFLDEITRTEPSVRQALTKILTDKKFMGMDMKIARIVAATNFPLDMPEELRDLYLTSDIDDPAFLDRFETIQVRPDDVLTSWRSWAKSEDKDGVNNIIPVITDFLEQYSQYYYDFSEVYLEYEKTGDFDDLSTKAFPNYRSWELLSNYLKSKESSKVFLQENIVGLIGDKCSKDFINFLVKNGWSQMQDEGNLDNIVRESLLSNVPTMLIGPSGLGKTARINNIGVKELGYKIINVNLAEQDRTDVMGPPAKVNTRDFIGGTLSVIDEGLNSKLDSILKDSGLPEKMTVKAPKANIAQEFKQSLEDGTPVILFFDECNRVTNPALMSAMFEAISDHRIFGVNFDPKMVRIVAACNMGEDFGDTQSLDPAFAARFNIHRKVKYDEDDAKSIKSYIKENYNPYLASYMDTLSNGELLDLVSSVEQRAIEESVPSTRAFNDLNLFISDEATSSVIKGRVLFPDRESKAKLSSVLRQSKTLDRELKEVISDVESKITNWSALDSPLTISINGEPSTATEIKELFDECKVQLVDNKDIDYLEPMCGLLSAMFNMDDEVTEMRQKSIGYIIGSASDQFCSFYNKVSGTKVVTIDIPDLKDKSLFKDYLNQVLATCRTPQLQITSLITTLTAIYDYFNLSLSVEHYREFINSSIDYLPTAESRYSLLNEMISHNSIDKIIEKAENNEEDYTIRLLDKAGKKVSKESLEDLKGTKPQVKTIVL